ncbi:universal stress protein [Cupriavidus necator]|uniref:universal stress protein n=1 Tax=Cupriavidus necator TaxID=106590 RepID=UPI0005B31AA6|nr:universal stress protein [Cupriavidus necator]
MAYNSILVHLDGNKQAMQRLHVAGRIAAASQCALIGLLAGRVPDPTWFYRMDNAQRCLAEDQERRRLQRENMRCAFEAATADLPLACEWRTADRDPVMLALREAREAGLIVSGQYDADNAEGPVARQLLEALLLETGRPTLVVPCAGEFASVGTRVLVAWNGSREAARALHDALPLLAGARVRVLSAHAAAREPRPDATPVSHAVRVLERQGATVEVEHGPGGADLAIGELILSRAADFGADLIVMGAYGHGRLRELVLAGVTRVVLQSMTVPVLFSH